MEAPGYSKEVSEEVKNIMIMVINEFKRRNMEFVRSGSVDGDLRQRASFIDGVWDSVYGAIRSSKTYRELRDKIDRLDDNIGDNTLWLYTVDACVKINDVIRAALRDY